MSNNPEDYIDYIHDNEWIEIKKKERKNKNKNEHNILNLNNIIELILFVLIKYQPYSIYLYGSRARGTNKIDSDVDIMVFWKRNNNNILKLSEIKNELEEILKIKVDLVNMIYINKYLIEYDERNKCYYDNILTDAICIYNNINHLQNLLETSIKLNKIE